MADGRRKKFPFEVWKSVCELVPKVCPKGIYPWGYAMEIYAEIPHVWRTIFWFRKAKTPWPTKPKSTLFLHSNGRGFRRKDKHHFEGSVGQNSSFKNFDPILGGLGIQMVTFKFLNQHNFPVHDFLTKLVTGKILWWQAHPVSPESLVRLWRRCREAGNSNVRCCVKMSGMNVYRWMDYLHTWPHMLRIMFFSGMQLYCFAVRMLFEDAAQQHLESIENVQNPSGRFPGENTTLWRRFLFL